MSRRTILLVGLVAVFMVLMGCRDRGIEPMLTSVYGVVEFEGDWPDNITFAFVVLADERPPGDVLDISYLVAYDDIPFESKPTTHEFEILPDMPGVYNWLFVAAIGSMDSIGPSNILAQYEDPDNPGEAGVVIIDTENFNAGTLYVDFSEVSIP